MKVCIIAKSVDYEDFSLEGYTYPAWGQALGWLQVAFILIWIPAVAIGVVWKEAKVSVTEDPLITVKKYKSIL